jgi:hypothetical protein
MFHVAAHGQNLDRRAGSRHHVGFGAPMWIMARAGFTAARATNPGPAPTTPVATLADGRHRGSPSYAGHQPEWTLLGCAQPGWPVQRGANFPANE